MTLASTGLRTLGLVCVPTVDQDTAIAFYEKLGFEKRTDVAMGDQYRWVEVYPPEGGTGIALAPPPPDRRDITPGDTGIILTTDDVERSHAEMQSLGVDVDTDISRMGDPVPPMFWFRDPSGHTLMVVQNS